MTRAKAVYYRRETRERHQQQAANAVLAISGALFSFFGLMLTASGYFSANYRSAFNVLAGFTLIVTGALVARRQRAALVAYAAVFAGTLTWSLRNLEHGGTSLAMRLAGPAILLLIAALLMPLLCGWRPRQAVTLFAVLMCGTGAFGVASAPDGPLAQSTAAVTHYLDSETNGILDD
jgi:glucose dehydrogenase